MNKNQFIGTLIFLACVVVAIGYVATLLHSTVANITRARIRRQERRKVGNHCFKTSS